MEDLFARAKKALALGHAALRKGLWELGLAWYAYAAGILTTMLTLTQADEVESTEQEDLVLATLLTQVENAIDDIKAEWGNGHKNPPNRGLAAGADAILGELDKLQF